MSLQDKEDKQEFCCPITLAPMQNPVVFIDGHTYEAEAIIQHIQEQTRRGTPVRSPVTNDVLAGPLLLAHNKNLRDAMEREGYIIDPLQPLPNLRGHTVPLETFCNLLGSSTKQKQEWLSFAVDHIVATKSVSGLSHIANTLRQLQYNDVDRLFQLLECFAHIPLLCIHITELLLDNLPILTNKKQALQALHHVWCGTSSDIHAIESQTVAVKLLLNLSRENLKRGQWWEDDLALQLIRYAFQAPVCTLFSELTLQACVLVTDLHHRGILAPDSGYREIFWGDILQLLDSPAMQTRAFLVHSLLVALRVLMEPMGTAKTPFNLTCYNTSSLPRVLAGIANNINNGVYGDCSAVVWSSVIFTLHAYLEISSEPAPSCLVTPLLQSCEKYSFVSKGDKELFDSIIATVIL